ncbi:beta-ketoacyl-ACP synthase II [Desulfomonile tiedjei]|uniref:3-oxoacyl-[acyl-carrier-protein] synthase 2 n=1 Tax=Desulfomonile tiedjei (strain ATCC 49306 / DSM 6799 / DCB-1) TaxID=706587 RepID=I4C2G3_DESTA|nr:beta-ketoacyl-ACP synthase II [Desulfomonile tiedjei]AFM23754.1 3-oxoacyl-(acyl-carrier-protein) synthase II [Desulfomonile tiedjei DSM 6799]
MPHKVVVTGMGMVTCLGTGVQANWEAVLNSRSGIGPITLFDAGLFATRIAGEVRGDFDVRGHVPAKELRRMDRYQQFCLVAAGEAMEQSGLPMPPEDPFRCAIVVGSGMGGLFTIESGVLAYHAKGPKGVHPLLIPKAVINLAPGMLSMRYGFRGANFGLVNACTSGTSAIGEGFRIVREGRADVVIAGGTEAVVTPLSIAAFNALRALSTRNDNPEAASRPFDRDRDGFVISEGAGILVLESEEHARRRGAEIHGEIMGYGATGDAYHFVMPDPEGEGAYRAMKMALEDAEIDPGEIGYINAHGTSTDLNDKMETLAIKKLFREAAYTVSISSTKSMTGHLIGAAGAVEAIYSLMALKTGNIPPTINLENPDPECDLDYTPHKSITRQLEYTLSNSFAFGGQNASLVFRRVS